MGEGNLANKAARTILVTGGAGFIGSNFVRYLYKKYPEDKIIVLDALTYSGSVQNLPEGSFDSNRFEFWYGNVRNAEIVDTLMAKSDIVFHFAAESHVTRSIYDNHHFFETDVLGSQVVANSVLKHKDRIQLLVHISTSEVYGSALSEKMDETHPLNPMSPYAAAKCGADRLMYSYWETYRIPIVIVRPFNNYGPYQHLEKLVPRFITNALLGESFKVHGDGAAMRDWLHVADHCAALDRLLCVPSERILGQVINLGTGNSLSILDIAKRVREITQLEDVKVEFIRNRPGQVFRHTCDNSKAKDLLDWEPRVDFEAGLRGVVEWYRENREWWSSQRWMRSVPIITEDGKRTWH